MRGYVGLLRHISLLWGPLGSVGQWHPKQASLPVAVLHPATELVRRHEAIEDRSHAYPGPHAHCLGDRFRVATGGEVVEHGLQRRHVLHPAPDASGADRDNSWQLVGAMPAPRAGRVDGAGRRRLPARGTTAERAKVSSSHDLTFPRLMVRFCLLSEREIISPRFPRFCRQETAAPRWSARRANWSRRTRRCCWGAAKARSRNPDIPTPRKSRLPLGR